MQLVIGNKDWYFLAPGRTGNFSEMSTVLFMWKNQNWHSGKAHYQKNGEKYEKHIGEKLV